MIYRAYKYRLWPTDAQAESLNRCFAAVRQVYNAALEQRRTYGRRKGSDAFGRASRFNAPRQAREINFRSQAGRPGLLDDPELRWITETPRDCLDAAPRDLDKAFDAFFAGRALFTLPQAMAFYACREASRSGWQTQSEFSMKRGCMA